VDFKPYPILACVKLIFIHYEGVVDLNLFLVMHQNLNTNFVKH
jgi:hypothetical protein